MSTLHNPGIQESSEEEMERDENESEKQSDTDESLKKKEQKKSVPLSQLCYVVLCRLAPAKYNDIISFR